MTTGLAIAEGIETALSAPFRPVWGCLDAGTLSRFPVLPGIECLTVFADHDEAGIKAALAVGRRWKQAGREVSLLRPPVPGQDFNDLLRAGMNGAPEDFTGELNRNSREDYFRDDPGAQSSDYKNGRARGNGHAEPGSEFAPRMWRRRDPKTIPPRPWLYGYALIRGEVTGWGSASGTGKTAALITTALASITGRDLLGQCPHRKCRWLILHCEESYDEFERRLAAAKQHFQIADEAIEGSLFHHSGDGFVIAREDANGTVTRQPIADKLLAFMTANAIDVAAADPFIATYIGKENQNETQSAVTRIWKNDVAKPANAAVLLVTHFRKGPADPGNADLFRGGRAFIDATRQAFTFTRMTDEEADQYGVDRDLRRQLIRVDDAKVNMAPKGGESWLKLVSVELGNVTAEYPNGDNVHAVEVWDAARRVQRRLLCGPQPNPRPNRQGPRRGRALFKPEGRRAVLGGPSDYAARQ